MNTDSIVPVEKTNQPTGNNITENITDVPNTISKYPTDDSSKKNYIKHIGTTKFLIPEKKKKIPWSILIIFLLLVLMAGGVYLILKYLPDAAISNPLSGNGNNEESKIDTRVVMNPLTGIMYTPEESMSWKDQRPIGVMVNNHLDARPQWGISDADLVYEIVAEGGITRYLAFYLTTLPDKLGPVRSTREYYLVLVKELGDAMIMHIGWSPQALEAIEVWPVRSLGRGGATFERDQSRLDQGIAIEHTAYVNGPYLRTLGDELGWQGVGNFNLYKFKDDQPVLNNYQGTNECELTKGLCDNITIDFWYKGDYSAGFKYNKETNMYLKFTGYDLSDQLVSTIDANSNKQVEVKNLIIQFVPEMAIEGDDKSRLEYQLVGSGEGLVFIDGGVAKVTWTKSDRDDRTMFYDQNGNEIQFNRGKFWISIVPDRNVDQVKY